MEVNTQPFATATYWYYTIEMKNIKIILILMTVLFITSLSAATKRKYKRFGLDVAYSESADTFEILDNVANWLPGFHDENYRK